MNTVVVTIIPALNNYLETRGKDKELVLRVREVG